MSSRLVDLCVVLGPGQYPYFQQTLRLRAQRKGVPAEVHCSLFGIDGDAQRGHARAGKVRIGSEILGLALQNVAVLQLHAELAFIQWLAAVDSSA